MQKCEFIDPTTNYECGKKFQTEMIHVVSPITREPRVYYVCGLHARMRFDALNRGDAEIQKLYDMNQINFKEKKERQSELWFRCKKCNRRFEKTDSIFIIIYYKFGNDVQVYVKKAFKVHRDCAIGEQFLYGLGREIAKDSKLDSF